MSSSSQLGQFCDLYKIELAHRHNKEISSIFKRRNLKTHTTQTQVLERRIFLTAYF